MGRYARLLVVLALAAWFESCEAAEAYDFQWKFTGDVRILLFAIFVGRFDVDGKS